MLRKSKSTSSNTNIDPSPSLQSSYSYKIPSTPLRRFSSSISTMKENFETAESIITKWDPNSARPFPQPSSLFRHNRKESQDFLNSTENLWRVMNFLVSENSSSDKLVLAQKLMQVAMKRLKKEFFHILSENREHLDPESVSGRSSNASITSDSEEKVRPNNRTISEEERIVQIAMSDLKSIADCMIGAGYGKECAKIYKTVRKSILEEALHDLGSIQQLKSSQIQKMSRESFEHQINKWIKAVRNSVRNIFKGERILCDYVFSASKTIRESCFFHITNLEAINLFKFPELITKSTSKRSSPEKIFPLLQIYEAMSQLWPEIESVFSSESTLPIKLQALSSIIKLGESVREILSEFESTIQKDSSKTPVLGGGVDPLTKSSMVYISSLAFYSEVLFGIISDNPLPRSSPLPESYFPNPAGSGELSTHLAWLIFVLLCKVDRKADLYKDVSLSYIFLANNLHFIVETVRKTCLKPILGDDWISTHTRRVTKYASYYDSLAWGKVYSSLPDKNIPEISPQVIKECFNRFNEAFQEEYKKQTSWQVEDGKLRDELKVSIASKLVPAYREFYESSLARLKEEKDLEMWVRIKPEDLGNYLSDLFHGATYSGFTSSSSSSSSSSSLTMRWLRSLSHRKVSP